MNIQIPDEVLERGIAAALERMVLGEMFVERVANAIARHFELLSPGAAADLLECSTRTLADNHVAWGLDKSLAYGPTNPKYFLPQIIERAKAKVIKGRKPPAALQVVKREGEAA